MALGATIPIPVTTTLFKALPSLPDIGLAVPPAAQRETSSQLDLTGPFADKINGISYALKSLHVLVVDRDFELILGFQNDVDKPCAIYFEIVNKETRFCNSVAKLVAEVRFQQIQECDTDMVALHKELPLG
jgi:hypothetical protein